MYELNIKCRLCVVFFVDVPQYAEKRASKNNGQKEEDDENMKEKKEIPRQMMCMGFHGLTYEYENINTV